MITGITECHLLLNKGNRGDGVIMRAAVLMLQEANINFTPFFHPQKVTGDTLLVLGNGCFASSYNWMADAVAEYYDSFNRIIILPTTFEDIPKIQDWAKNAPAKVEVWCRDVTSFDIISRYRPAQLHDDLAFSLDLTEYKKEGTGTLLAFRLDKEKTRITIPDGNKDISQGNSFEWEPFIKEIAEYAEVKTNRLHVAIIATLLGKKVTLYPNSYHKNQSVYKTTLYKYANCSFSDTKYVCVGSPKTATTSLAQAFRQLGFTAKHFDPDMVSLYYDEKIPELLEQVSEYTFLGDMPFRFLYRELDARYHCKFILTIRDETEWLRSYKEAVEQTKFSVADAVRFKKYGCDILAQPDEYILENVYRKQNAEVLDYFKDRPSDLLVVDLTKGNQWDVLCPFTNTTIPNSPFPCLNRTQWGKSI